MLRKIVDFANVTITVLTGFYLMLLTVARTDGLAAVPAGMISSVGWILFFFIIGLALVASNVYLMVKDWKAGGFRRNLRIASDQGMNEFSLNALEALIVRDLRMEPDITDPEVILTPREKGKPMTCEVELKLKRQEDVGKRMDAIKRKIVDTIERLIPGALSLDIMIEVRDFVSEVPRSRDGGGEPGEFNGPVYANAVHGSSESV